MANLKPQHLSLVDVARLGLKYGLIDAKKNLKVSKSWAKITGYCDRTSILKNKEMLFTCEEDWELALAGRIGRLVADINSNSISFESLDHFSSLRIIEQAYALPTQIRWEAGLFASLLGMVLIIPHIRFKFATVIHERIVHGNNSMFGITHIRFALHQLKSQFVEILVHSGRISKKEIESGLIGGLSEFTVDSRDRFILGDHQASEIFRKMFALQFICKNRTKFKKELLVPLAGLSEQVNIMIQGFPDRRISSHRQQACSL